MEPLPSSSPSLLPRWGRGCCLGVDSTSHVTGAVLGRDSEILHVSIPPITGCVAMASLLHVSGFQFPSLKRNRTNSSSKCFVSLKNWGKGWGEAAEKLRRWVGVSNPHVKPVMCARTEKPPTPPSPPPSYILWS